MPRRDGSQTKARILRIAEQLFAEGGFDKTSVDKIARGAGVNKALIYYYFKDKNDIIASLFVQILEELEAESEPGEGSSRARRQPPTPRDELREELEFMIRRRKILAVMLMEGLKGSGGSAVLFRLGELAIRREQESPGTGRSSAARGRKQRRRLVYDFFTGLIPMIAFATLQDSWCKYFSCDPGEALDHFLDSFEGAHLAAHRNF